MIVLGAFLWNLFTSLFLRYWTPLGAFPEHQWFSGIAQIPVLLTHPCMVFAGDMWKELHFKQYKKPDFRRPKKKGGSLGNSFIAH